MIVKRFIVRALPAVLAALLLGGCVQVPEKVDINFNNNGQSSSGGSQLPAGNGGGSLADLAYGVGGYMVGAQSDVLFYGYDALAYPGKQVEITAQVRDVRGVLRGLQDASVGFYRDGELVSSALTDKDGMATIEWTPPRRGDYHFEAKMLRVPENTDANVAKVEPAPLVVLARPKDEKFVVIDLDHTVVADSFWRVLLGGARPMADSVRVTRRIAREYSIIYLTHRPDLLARKSRGWLDEHGYPTGVLMVGTLEDAIGDSGAYKTARLGDVTERFSRLEIGIGDKYSDAQAYVNHRMTAYLIPHYDPDDLDEVRKAARSIRQIDDKGRLNVVDGWSQVEAGIFRGKEFPPGQYVRQLESRADRLRREDRDDDDEDDEDDDDDDDEEEEEDD